MNNHIYTTKAFLMKSVSTGEANKIYFLFTADLGLVRATAQGIRLEKSKLKGHLQDLYFVNVSLVKGKDLWRIVSAEAIYQDLFLENKDKLFVLKNIFSLLLRLIHGEEKNEQLFLLIEDFYHFLRENNLKTIDLKNLETIIVLRILESLGYFKKESAIFNFEDITILSFATLEYFDSKRKAVIQEINEALKQTYL